MATTCRISLGYPCFCDFLVYIFFQNFVAASLSASSRADLIFLLTLSFFSLLIAFTNVLFAFSPSICANASATAVRALGKLVFKSGLMFGTASTSPCSSILAAPIRRHWCRFRSIACQPFPNSCSLPRNLLKHHTIPAAGCSIHLLLGGSNRPAPETRRSWLLARRFLR